MILEVPRVQNCTPLIACQDICLLARPSCLPIQCPYTYIRDQHAVMLQKQHNYKYVPTATSTQPRCAKMCNLDNHGHRYGSCGCECMIINSIPQHRTTTETALQQGWARNSAGHTHPSTPHQRLPRTHAPTYAPKSVTSPYLAACGRVPRPYPPGPRPSGTCRTPTAPPLHLAAALAAARPAGAGHTGRRRGAQHAPRTTGAGA